MNDRSAFNASRAYERGKCPDLQRCAQSSQAEHSMQHLTSFERSFEV